MRFTARIMVLALLTASGMPGNAQEKAGPDPENIAATCWKGDPSASIASASPADRIAFMSCVQGQVAQQLNVKVPYKVDEATTMTAITANGTIITYHQTADLAVKDLPSGAVQKLIDATRDSICSQSDMRTIIGLGGGYRYVWSDRNGAAIGETTIDKC